jgi:hypothetical protein
MDLNGLSAISYLQRTPIELDKPHIFALAAETGFLLFKEQVLLKFKKETSAVQCKRKTFRLISLSTPVSFRWTVPLMYNLEFCERRHIIDDVILKHFFCTKHNKNTIGQGR